MVKLRLKRIGKKQMPFYRIVAADSRVNRNGKYIELIGTFDPLKNEVKINKEIALKWLNDGAQPTDTVRGLFSDQGIMTELHEAKAKSAKGEKKPAKKAKISKAKFEAKKAKREANKKAAEGRAKFLAAQAKKAEAEAKANEAPAAEPAPEAAPAADEEAK